VDTPGLHRPRTALGERLNDHVGEALDDVDVVIAVLDATASVGPGDRLVLQRCAESVRGRSGVLDHLLVVINKIDLATDQQVLLQLVEVQKAVVAGPGAPTGPTSADPEASAAIGSDEGVEYFPISAITGQGVEELVKAVFDRLPQGPPYYPPEMLSDVPEAFWVAELVREQLLARVHEELPHAIACRVTEWEWPRVRIEILVERESQKGIVIGKGGTVLKAVGIAVREQLPPGAFVELHVRVEKRWQQKPDSIERLGY
jgi:GTP-binding protein Era